MSLSTIVTDEPLMIGHGDTIEYFLTSQKGQQVTIRLGSGEDLTGTVKEVTGPLVQLSTLSGKEFYDAVIVTKNITAVIVRTRTP